MSTQRPETTRSRRSFLAGGAFLGTGLVVPAIAAEEQSNGLKVLNSDRPDAPYELADPENTIYSACLQCNTGCGIKCKLQDGVVTKIDGNPYNPWTLLPHLPYATAVDDANPVDGAICPKGHASRQYIPTRRSSTESSCRSSSTIRASHPMRFTATFADRCHPPILLYVGR